MVSVPIAGPSLRGPDFDLAHVVPNTKKNGGGNSDNAVSQKVCAIIVVNIWHDQDSVNAKIVQIVVTINKRHVNVNGAVKLFAPTAENARAVEKMIGFS